MMPRFTPRLLAVAVLSVAALVFARAAAPRDRTPGGKQPETKFTPEAVAFFEKEVQPILKAHCLKCHGDNPKKIRGGLRLTSRDHVLKGGDLGPTVSLDRPESSLLFKALSHKDEKFKMPPAGRLSDRDIDVLTRWVKAGLPWTPGTSVGTRPPEHSGGKVTDEARKYWAYQPVKRPVIPTVKDPQWVRNPSDAFLLASTEEKGLTNATSAEPQPEVARP